MLIPNETSTNRHFDENKTDPLAFLTPEGEVIDFGDLDMPIGEATAIAGEDAVRKIWERPSEELAWRDM